MEKITTTFIATVKNSEKDIIVFLDSLFNQTMLPDEIIIVDAFSTDSTAVYIKRYIQDKKNIFFLQQKGNRSVGRNTAIKQATGTIIAASDIGCILQSNWFENITKPFKQNAIDIVSGYYLPQTKNIFEECLATYTCVMPDTIDKNNFLPSSRSVAFKKSAWESVGGYPENLDTCEDLLFAQKLKNTGKKFIFEQDAIVFWQQRHTLLQAAKQFYSYASGDGKARFFRKTTPFLFLRYIVALVLLAFAITTNNFSVFALLFLVFIIYLFWAIYKNYRYIKHPLAFFYLPLLQLTADVCVISGTIVGFLKSLYENR